MNCIIHYENQSKYSVIKKLYPTNISRILDAKEKRINVGGKNDYKEQIRQISNEIDEEIHGIHLEPCYKR